MPELPEVETSRLLVEEYCAGKKIDKVEALEDPSEILYLTGHDMTDPIAGIERGGVHLQCTIVLEHVLLTCLVSPAMNTHLLNCLYLHSARRFSSYHSSTFSLFFLMYVYRGV
jgi:hypothetical protein